MADEMTAVKTTAAKTKQAHPQWSAVNLRSPDGARLSAYARVVRDGFRSGVEHASPPANGASGKRTYQKGATSQHATWTEAIQQRDKLAAEALKAGWTKPTGPIGQPRPDSFSADSLPRPGAPKPEAKPAGKK